MGGPEERPRKNIEGSKRPSSVEESPSKIEGSENPSSVEESPERRGWRDPRKPSSVETMDGPKEPTLIDSSSSAPSSLPVAKMQEIQEVKTQNEDDLTCAFGNLLSVVVGESHRNLIGKGIAEGNGDDSGRVYPTSIMGEAVAKLQLDYEPDFCLATLKCEDELLSFSDPVIFKTPASDSYMVVCESYLEDSSSEQDLAAAGKSLEPDRALVPEDGVGCCLLNKQAQEFVAFVGLEFVPGATHARFERSDYAVYSVSKPSVFKSPSSDLYFIFGETEIETIKEYADETSSVHEDEDFHYEELENKFKPADIKTLMDLFEMEKSEALECLDCFDGDVIQAVAYNCVYRKSMVTSQSSE